MDYLRGGGGGGGGGGGEGGAKGMLGPPSQIIGWGAWPPPLLTPMGYRVQ